MAVMSTYFWAAVEKFAPLLVSFLVTVIVARMVGPAAYGLVGMLALFLALGEAMVQLSLNNALVQQEEVTAEDEASVFYTNVFMGFLVLGLFFLCAERIADFYAEPLLSDLLKVQALSLPILAFSYVQMARLERDMVFAKGAVIQLLAVVVSGGVAIVLAYQGHGVWSLAWMTVTSALVRTIAAWLLIGWRPAAGFSSVRLKSMWRYTSRLLYSSLVHRVVTNLYMVLIGKSMGTEPLGIFMRAIGLQTLVTGLVVGVVQRVTFPAFSRLQNDEAALLAELRLHTGVLAMFASFLMGSLYLVSSWLIVFLFGPEWSDSAVVLNVLCLAGVLSAVSPLYSQAVMALGDSDVFFKIELLKKFVVFLILLVAFRFGLMGFAWGMVAISVTDYLLSVWPVRGRLKYSWIRQGTSCQPASWWASRFSCVRNLMQSCPLQAG